MTDQEKKASFFEEAFFNLKQTYIHPTAIVGPQVKLENNVKIGPYCTIVGKVKIGTGSRLHANVMVGFPAQNLGTKQSLGSVIIKSNCEIREFVTIHASKYHDGKTEIGNNCYLMNFAHVAHDAILEDNITLINNVNLGGHTYVEKNAILMAGAATHQFCRIGQFTALAPFSAIRQDLPPFCLFNGQPAAFSGLNTIGLKRANLTTTDISALKKITKLFYLKKQPFDTIQAQIQKEEWGKNPYVQVFMTFIASSSRGISRLSILNNIRKDLTS